jgi:TatD DNase family protein
MSIIFDSHCHPQFPQYEKDRDEVIKQTLEMGVFMICVGTDSRTSKEALGLAEAYEGIWAAIGLHPNDNLDEEFDEEEFRDLLEHPKAVAMGEIGLDYYRTEKPEDQEIQKKRFEKQLNLIEKVGKPVILHFRDSQKGSAGRVHTDAIGMLKDRKLEGVAHSFTGNLEEARQYLKLGFHLGFNGIITFARQYDEIVRETPLDRLLLETDAPYLTPEPYRGKRNEPAYVMEVAKKVAELKGETLEKVIEQTTRNCKNLFRLEEIKI